MTVRTYIHSPSKRAETTALLDSGAAENFMNLAYAKWLKLPSKTLRYPRPLFNVNGSTNKQGDLKFYSDLVVRTGMMRKNMRFFLSDLGNHQIILGYPWFAAYQPKVDWARGWIDVSQLPIIISSPDTPKIHPNPRPSLVLNAKTDDDQSVDQRVYVARISFPSSQLTNEDRETLQKIPLEYRRHARVFSESAAQRFPGPRIWDHAIELKPDAPATIPRKIYSLTVAEQDELLKFVKEHVAKGYIRPSKSPYAAPFFFIKKKDGKLRPVQDYRRLNQWTIRNTYPLPLIPQLINKARSRALFSKFDIRWGYNNVRIREGDQW